MRSVGIKIRARARPGDASLIIELGEESPHKTVAFGVKKTRVYVH
jgi:hypothetical protein